MIKKPTPPLQCEPPTQAVLASGDVGQSPAEIREEDVPSPSKSDVDRHDLQSEMELGASSLHAVRSEVNLGTSQPQNTRKPPRPKQETKKLSYKEQAKLELNFHPANSDHLKVDDNSVSGESANSANYMEDDRHVPKRRIPVSRKGDMPITQVPQLINSGSFRVDSDNL